MKTNLILIFLITFGSLLFAGRMWDGNYSYGEFGMKMNDCLAFKNEGFEPEAPPFAHKQYGKNNKGFKKGKGFGFDKEVEEKILEECKSKYPEFHKFLLSIKEKDEFFYRKALHKFGKKGFMMKSGMLAESDEFKALSEKELELETKLLPKIYEYRKSKSDKLQKEITDLLNEQFDIRQKKFEIMLNFHKQEIEKMQKDLEERKNKKEELVKEQFERITEIGRRSNRMNFKDRW